MWGPKNWGAISFGGAKICGWGAYAPTPLVSLLPTILSHHHVSGGGIKIMEHTSKKVVTWGIGSTVFSLIVEEIWAGFGLSILS